MKHGLAKRGLRGASLDELEKNLAEAFAILETLGVSTDVNIPYFCSPLIFLMPQYHVLSDEAWHVKAGAEGCKPGPT